MSIKTLTKIFHFNNIGGSGNTDGFVANYHPGEYNGNFFDHPVNMSADFTTGIPSGSLVANYQATGGPSGDYSWSNDKLVSWDWFGPWTDLGVPSHAIVEAVQLTSVYLASELNQDINKIKTTYNIYQSGTTTGFNFFLQEYNNFGFIQSNPFAVYSGDSHNVGFFNLYPTIKHAEDIIEISLLHEFQSNQRTDPVFGITYGGTGSVWDDELNLLITYDDQNPSGDCHLATPHPIINCSGTFSPPIYSGVAQLNLHNPRLSAAGVMHPPVYSGSAHLALHNLTLTAKGIDYQPKSGSIPLYLFSTFHINEGLNLFLQGPRLTPTSNSLPLVMFSTEGSGLFSKLDLFVEGGAFGESLNLYISGEAFPQTGGNSLNLFLYNTENLPYNVLPLYLENKQEEISGWLPLSIKGAGKTWDYIPANGSVNLYMSGDGTPYILPAYISDSLDMFVHGDFLHSDYMTGAITLFLQVEPGYQLNNTLNLYASGGSPILVSGVLNLAIPRTNLHNILPMFTHGF